MRFSLALPVDRVDAPEEFQTAEAVSEIARAAETAGFDAVFVTDHPIPERVWLEQGGHQALDPLVPLSIAAGATTRLRVQTHLYVLPYRSPYLTAKAVASLDALSRGRVLFGVGAGYLEAEFVALGADFAGRNERADEAIREMRRVWSGEYVRIGDHEYRSLPRPAQQPHPTIWGGGNSRRAIRRAVELCDGWVPFPNPPSASRRVRTPPLVTLEDLSERIDYAREHAARCGRTGDWDVVFAPLIKHSYGQPGFSLQEMMDQVGAQAELGVTRMATLFERTGRIHVPSRKDYLERIEGFGREVIAALG